MKLRRFTSAGVEMARQYLAAVKESNDVENVTPTAPHGSLAIDP
jgi:hypothetical protein